MAAQTHIRWAIALAVVSLGGAVPRAGAGTMTGNVQIGSALPGATLSGTNPYLYDFAGDSLAMAGYKLYYNTGLRNVVLTNLAGIANGGSVDTSRSGADNHTGYIEIYSSGAVAFTNNLTTRNPGDAATGRILVNATDIRVGGGVMTDSQGNGDNAGGITLAASAGDVQITNHISSYVHGGGVSCAAGAVSLTASRVTISGLNSYGYAIDAHGGSAAGQHIYGNEVMLQATSGVTLATGGISTYGYGGGAVTITGGAGGSAGDIYIGGNILSYNNEGIRLPGRVAITGANIRVTGYIDADQKGSGVGSPAFAPVAIVGSGSVRVDGYVTASRSGSSGIMSGDHSVFIQGASVTVGGVNGGGYSVLAMNACGNAGENADNISLIATAGDITVAGGYDASAAGGASLFRAVTNIASGNITIGSLNASRFKSITLMAGQTATNWIYVTGVLTNFTKTESPKRFTFPAGSVVSNNIYYHPVNNGAGLTGEYSIYVSTTDTGKKLIEGPPPAPGGNPPIVVNLGATNFIDTSASLAGWMASTGSAESVAFLYWSTADGTTNAATWLAGGSVSNLGVKAKGATFTNTITGLGANTTYYWNHMGSNAAGLAWAAATGSPSFRTDGPPGVDTNVGATVVGAYSATLNGTLTDSRQSRIFVYYGTDYNNWTFTKDLGWRGTGTFSTVASGLSQNTLYYYQCRATNIYGNVLSGVASFTTKIPATTNMTGDVYIGNVLGGISSTGTAPYTYDFGAYRTLDMGGYKLYCNDLDPTRSVLLTNLLGIANGGSVDTSRSGNYSTGNIEIYCDGPVVFANNLTTLNDSQKATGRITVNATDVAIGGGVLTRNYGWNGSAGAVTINASSGSIAITNLVSTFNHSAGGLNNYAGTVTMNAAGSIRVGGAAGGYAIDASGNGTTNGWHQGGMPVALTASNGVTLATGGIATYGYGGGNVAVINSGSGNITIGGSITTLSDEGSRVAGNVLLSAAAGNITVAGGYDAYCLAGAASYGTVTNIASGRITLGSLNAARFRSIALQPGGGKYGIIHVTGVLTNFPVSESPKTFTFPAGSFVGNDVYYTPASNTAIGLTGEYAIYVSTSNTAWKLKEGPPPYQQPGTMLMVW